MLGRFEDRRRHRYIVEETPFLVRDGVPCMAVKDTFSRKPPKAIISVHPDRKSAEERANFYEALARALGEA